MRKVFDRIAGGLASSLGHAIEDDFLSRTEVDDLVRDFDLRRESFKSAKVGRTANSTDGHMLTAERREEIRQDSTLWFDPLQLSFAQAVLWNRLEGLREGLNERLMLGLWDLEGHYASYQPGGFYKRHLDRFQSNDARTISVVFYLNENWKKADGGALRIYNSPPHESSIEVEPRAGRVVCFLSDRTEHEVLESAKERKSFAGWFRRRI